MTPREAAGLSAVALRIAREAGELARLGYRRPKIVTHKGEVDLVTEFDTRCEALIRERLARDVPGVAIVAEEGGGAAGADLTIYVDPIDGTTNYAHGHPFWCVSIGVVDGGGTAVAGAVVAPSLDAWWQGSLGEPSVRDGAACHVSATRTIKDALLATGFPYDRKTSPENNFDAFVALKKRAQAVRRCGSAALDLCLVADGTYDGYWERKLKPWDLAAGACVVAGAGGRISDFEGRAPDLVVGHLVATNDRLHGALLDALAGRD